MESDAIPDTMEGKLRHLFEKTIKAAHSSDERHTAVRWFNRLYYEVRRWNGELLKFLHSYPGFKDKAIEEEYIQFSDTLDNYGEALWKFYSTLESGEVKINLCSNLTILAFRFATDFAWLRESDDETYKLVLSSISLAQSGPNTFLRLAKSVIAFIDGVSMEGPEWHAEHHSEVIQKIQDYENASRQEVNKLHEIAMKIGATLLSVDEYERALATDGSHNPNLMVIGELTMGDKNTASQGGIIISRSSQIEGNTFNQTWNQLQNSIELSQLVVELSKLRQEMKRESVSPEQDIAISDVAKAEQAAKAGDGSKAMEHLKSAGQWALDVATKIGTSLAVEAIKGATGLK